jgi:23S rRNA pseudouridine1911/1915/1917 synthase
MEKLPEEYDDQEENPLFEHYRITADPGQSLIRIDRFLTGQLPHASRSRLQAAAEAGFIRVNDVPVKSSYKVKPGDVVVVLLDRPKQDFRIIPEDIPLNIVYEDEELMVINKDPGIVVHPGHGNYSGTLVNALSFHLKNLPLFSEDDTRPGLVHRIDKDTSGLIVVAKTEHAKMNLSYQFYEKTTHRKYIALVWGDLKQEKGTIEGNIGRSLSNRQMFTVFPEGEHGKKAVTHYKVIERLGYVNLVECQLETGRTHQIRVHMKYIGHPLFNDAMYGGNQILRGTTFAKYRQFVHNCFDLLPRQALHAKTLGFLHPVTGKMMLFDSELPDDMTQVIGKWRNYIASRETS